MHSDASPEWRRLLYWLLRSRRREPLNGVMLVIDAHSLLTESEEHLAEQGQNLRYRLNDLVQVFGARLPVYFIITGAQAIPGLLQWGQALTPAQRQQPLGLLSQQRSQGATAFLDEVFTGLAQRLADLRISLGVARLTRRASVQPARADHHLAPEAGKVTHPSLRCQSVQRAGTAFGFVFHREHRKCRRGARGWFSHALLATLLPGQRYAYQPIDSWHRWRRLMVHAAVVAWLMAAAAAGTLLVYAQRHTSETLAAAAGEPPKMATFKAGLETDLDAMRRFRQALLNMTGTTAARLAQAVAFFRAY